MTEIVWTIPPSVLARLETAPADRPVVLLLRHSVRGHLPFGPAGDSVPITEDGQRIARELGALLGSRLRTLHSSPVLRCVQTAECISAAAGSDLAVTEDRHLGNPSVYVLGGAAALAVWERLGHEGVMQHFVSKSEALPGLTRPDEAARFLVHHMLAVAGEVPGVHVFVTHDHIVTTTAARLVTRPLGPEYWPWFLEGAFFWRTDDGVMTAYRDIEAVRPGKQLCGFAEHDVVEHARREVAATVALDSGARFFVAGGTFKTLLSGRPSRDLDLWAPSKSDRDAIIARLIERGAKRLTGGAFNDAFEIHGRVVEVPHKVEPPTLEERLGRFDIGLSAVGVEHRSDGSWRALIHPVAIASAARHEVRLLKPLVNWRYALATLERLRRYAEELGFTVPPEEEAEVWRVFDMQDDEVQGGMLDRFARTTRSGFGVAEEAAQRRRRQRTEG